MHAVDAAAVAGDVTPVDVAVLPVEVNRHRVGQLVSQVTRLTLRNRHIAQVVAVRHQQHRPWLYEIKSTLFSKTRQYTHCAGSSG